MAETIRLIVLDANVLVAAAVAILAGFVSFASPCVLPLVPGYQSFVTGLAGETLAGAGGAGALIEPVLGEQQVEIGGLTAVHRQAPGHVPLG